MDCKSTDSFNAGYGDCRVYQEEAFAVYCRGDFDDGPGIYAYEACPQCGECTGVPTPTEPETTTQAKETKQSILDDDTFMKILIAGGIFLLTTLLCLMVCVGIAYKCSSRFRQSCASEPREATADEMVQYDEDMWDDDLDPGKRKSRASTASSFSQRPSTSRATTPMSRHSRTGTPTSAGFSPTAPSSPTNSRSTRGASPTTSRASTPSAFGRAGTPMRAGTPTRRPLSCPPVR